MKRWRWALAIFLAALPLAPAWARVQIVAIGDSGIRGKGVSEQEAYPAQLERALRAKGYDVSVTNEGVNGDTTEGVLERLDGAVPPGTRIAIVSVGGNDLVVWHRPMPEVMATRREIVDRLRQRGIAVYPIWRMQDGGLHERYDLHVESAPTPGRTDWHLNATGYSIVVARTLPAIEALVRKVEHQP